MNKTNQKKFLVSLKTTYRCTECRASFNDEDVKFLHSVEQFDYAELTCHDCDKKTLFRIAKR
jgi:DNA-directed RNA polymerase subunit RPC12/RpoP